MPSRKLPNIHPKLLASQAESTFEQLFPVRHVLSTPLPSLLSPIFAGLPPGAPEPGGKNQGKGFNTYTYSSKHIYVCVLQCDPWCIWSACACLVTVNQLLSARARVSRLVRSTSRVRLETNVNGSRYGLVRLNIFKRHVPPEST